MTGFTGTLEQRADNLQDFKEMRLRRLQQVRQQEKILSADRCDAYRKVIGIRKQLKTEIIKDALISEKRLLHDKLTVQWQSSLVDTGNAHRTASEISSINRVRKRNDDLSDVKKRNVAEQRGRDAVNEITREVKEQQRVTADRLERGSLRAVAKASDREDARATAEARAARRAWKGECKVQQELACSQLQRSSSGVTLARQSAVRIQDRGPVLRDTNVVRHGQLRNNEPPVPNGPVTEGRNVFAKPMNSAVAAERHALSKQWGTVMKEMLHRKATASRATAARKTIASTNRADELHIELFLLSQADKATCRAAKARNAASVRAAPHHTDATPVAVRAFEREFMSASNIFVGPATSTATSNDVDDRAPAVSEGLAEAPVAETKYDLAQPVPARQPKMWDEERVVTHVRPDSVRMSLTSFGATQRGVISGVVRSSSASQPSRAPPAWSTPQDEEEGSPELSTWNRDRAVEYPISVPSPLGEDEEPLNMPRSPQVLRVTDLFLPPSPFSEEGSLFCSEEEATDAIERSTSTANTLAARHDYSLSPTRQQPIQLGGRRSPDDYSTSSSQSEDLFSPSKPQSRSSSAPLSSLTYGSYHHKYQLSINRDEEEEEGEGDESKGDEGVDPLGVSVRMRTLPAAGARGYPRSSEDSFEVFYEDEEEGNEEEGDEEEGGEGEEDEEGESEDLSLHWVRSRVVQSSGGDESVRSSESPEGVDDPGDSEADDNMSAITWPDLTSRNAVSYGKGASPEDMLSRAGGDRKSSNDDDEDEEEEEHEEEEYVRPVAARVDDSIEGDDFLQELDALSLSWMQRRKVLQDKDKWSER